MGRLKGYIPDLVFKQLVLGAYLIIWKIGSMFYNILICIFLQFFTTMIDCNLHARKRTVSAHVYTTK